MAHLHELKPSVSHRGGAIPLISNIGRYDHTSNEVTFAASTLITSTPQCGSLDRQIHRQMSSTPQMSRDRLVNVLCYSWLCVLLIALQCPEDVYALSEPLASENTRSPPTSEVPQTLKTKCMVFTFEGKPGVPLSLAFAGSDALYGLSDSEDRSFFEGFGEKVMYKIPVSVHHRIHLQ